jgi:hypothetical protein
MRTLQFGLIESETVLPNFAKSFMSGAPSRDFIMRPGARLILVDRHGQDVKEGYLCQTYLCETVIAFSIPGECGGILCGTPSGWTSTMAAGVASGQRFPG